MGVTNKYVNSLAILRGDVGRHHVPSIILLSNSQVHIARIEQSWMVAVMIDHANGMGFWSQ